MRVTTGVVLWLAAAAAATAVGMFAVGAIGSDIFGPGQQQPLSESEVDRRLAASTAPATTTTGAPPTTSSAPPPPSTSRPTAAAPSVVQSAGGSVIARCAPGGLVEVVQSVPAQGFQIHSSDSGELDDHPSVKFRSGDREVEIRLRCRGGQLTHEVRDD